MVPYLGAAFGTKLIYFAADRSTRRPAPLIYDGNVRLGLLAMGQDFPPPSSLTTPRYIAYLELAERIANEAAVSPDVVEYTLFDMGKRKFPKLMAERYR